MDHGGPDPKGPSPLLFGAIVAMILIGLYASAVLVCIHWEVAASSKAQPPAAQPPAAQPPAAQPPAAKEDWLSGTLAETPGGGNTTGPAPAPTPPPPGGGKPTDLTPPIQLSEGLLAILTMVGGLASALVVAIMAATSTGTRFPGRLLADDASGGEQTAAQILTWVYLVVWLACGGLMLVFWALHPNRVPALDSAAKSWLGIAVAAGYSYFGIKQK